MAKMTPQIAGIVQKLDIYMTVVRQRAEILAGLESDAELLWEPDTKDSPQKHRTILDLHLRVVERHVAALRSQGWMGFSKYAMPATVKRGDVMAVLPETRGNNDAHLWDDFGAAIRQIAQKTT